MNLNGKKIALVGGAGFIGHNLALQLNALGAEVSVVDGLQVNNLLYLSQTNVDIVNRDLYIRFVNERLKLLELKGIRLFVEDARKYPKLSKVLTDIEPDIVVLLAAVSHANRSNKDPYSTFDHSFRTLENALDATRGRIEHFIYFSSSMVYGNFEGGYVDEESTCTPIGIYGALKYGAEKLVIAYNQVFDLPYTIVRPSALYGERCVSRRVLQIFIEKALAGEEISISGNGEDKLDFTYIDDLVSGIICVISNPASKGEIFNLTYGEGRSLNDAVEILKKSFPNLSVKYLPKDKLMPDRGTLSVEKAKSLIGYDPQSPLDVGLEKYVNWYKDTYPNL